MTRPLLAGIFCEGLSPPPEGAPEMLRPTEAFFLRAASVLVGVCALGVTLAPRLALSLVLDRMMP